MKNKIFLWVAWICFFGLSHSAAIAQVKTAVEERAGSIVLSKEIPKKPDSTATNMLNDGSPQFYFAVQLARFEQMYYYPDAFPEGTTLWINPDHENEAILVSSTFYPSYERAQVAAEYIKRQGQFPSAFARAKPLFIRFE